MRLAAFHSTALVGMSKLEMSVEDAVALISGIDGAACFYKSMKAIKDRSGQHWQDVYHVPVPSTGQMVYVKFSPIVHVAPRSGVAPKPPQIVISFKSLDPKDN